MQFTLVVYGAPHSAQGAGTALRFAKAVLASGHSIFRVFFYGDGIHNGSALATPPQDEQDLLRQWQALQQSHQLDLTVCIAAAQRRGVLSESEANRLERPAANLADGFTLAGLGQLAEATALSDRLVSFGG
ncbi:sulfurtransferase complex subunit TusD [Microbulbifer sp. HZ11]|uniref:sulfurtransferase complex subunit TusD n=1 Tax=unclassified Microbulbifer TaxID=2619833 RepID=UPI0005BC1FF1|nr:sulfurtransferase complex subunit TusD [Microbulbifer sp. HZ11]